MNEAQLIYETNVAGLEAFRKLSLKERLKWLEEMGLIDSNHKLTVTYGGTAKPSKAYKQVK